MSRKARIRNRITLGIFLCALLIWGLYSLALDRGKGFIEKQLENYFGKDVKLISLKIIPILRLELDGLTIGELLDVRRVVISSSLVGMLLGRIAFNDLVLIEPKIELRLNQDGKVDFPLLEVQKNIADSLESQILEQKQTVKNESQAKKLKERVKKRLIIISSLHIKNGKLTFTDFKVSQPALKIIIDNINVEASKLSLSAIPSQTNFKVRAEVVSSPSKKATLSLQGWINLFKKDMEAKFNLSELDITLFSPYYDSLTKTQIKSGTVNVEAVLKSKNNDLVIETQMGAKDLLIKEPVEKGESVLSALSPFLFGVLDTRDGSLQKITLMGKLYPLQIEKVNFNVSVAKDKLKDLFSDEPQEVFDKAKGVARALGEQAETSRPKDFQPPTVNAEVKENFVPSP